MKEAAPAMAQPFVLLGEEGVRLRLFPLPSYSFSFLFPFLPSSSILFPSSFHPPPSSPHLSPAPNGNYPGGCKAMYHILFEGAWLSYIGRMAEVRNVPHLACSKFADESGEVASSDLAASKNN